MKNLKCFIKDKIRALRIYWDYLLILNYKKKAYFGYLYSAAEVNPSRAFYMRKIFNHLAREKKLNKVFFMIEIGSWAGHSSVLWAEQFKRMNLSGKIICIDPWRLYPEIKDKPYPNRQCMAKAVKNDRIFKLFCHNIHVSGHDDIIVYFRGRSSDLLPFFKEDFFDLIYIDGSHYYNDVKNDIENAMRLIRDGGVICGDDLEMQRPALEPAIDCEKIRSCVDGEPMEYSNIPTHLGVTLAVWDMFQQEVSAWNGFWAMKKEKNHYIKISLNHD